jgi:hypothetical protein
MAGFQIQASDKIVKLNDSPLLGQVQSVSYNPTLQTEEIFELGRDTRIAAAQELSVQGSFDILSIGGSAGILSRMIMTRNAGTGAFTGYAYDATITSGTTGSGTTTTITTTGLTAGAHNGQYIVITGGTGGAAALIGLRRRIVSNTTTLITFTPALPAAADSTVTWRITGGPNQYSFTQSSLRESIFDIVMNERDDSVTFNSSTVLPRQFLRSIACRFQAQGSATETYNFGGDFAFVAKAPYHDLRAVPATRTSGTTVTLADTSVSSANSYLGYLYIDERRIDVDTTKSIYASLGLAGVITVTGFTIPTTARISALVYRQTPATTFPTITERATPEFYARGYQTDIYVAPTDPFAATANEQWLKVQSLDFNIDLRVQELRQIAFNASGTSQYFQAPTYPFSVTSNLSVIEADLLDWRRMMNSTVKSFSGAFTGAGFNANTYDLSPNSMLDSFAVVVQIRTRTGTLVQRWVLGDQKVEGFGSRVNVGGRSEITWNLRGTQFQLDGFNL